MRTVRVFLSSPGDVMQERALIERVVARLNGEFSGAVFMQTIRWESDFYKGHATFQAQIPEASDCDIVLGIFGARLGSPMPPGFKAMPGGNPYPSGSAYEILSAIERRTSGADLPDVYVFRAGKPPLVRLGNDAELIDARTQWNALEDFFKRYFLTADGQYVRAFHTFANADDLAVQVEKLLREWIEQHVLRARTLVWPTALKGSPFRGLSAFGAKHASVFFGRGREIGRAIDLLAEGAKRGSPFLLIVGASGAGKSSLLRAGVVPRLTAPGVVAEVDVWRVVSMRPVEGQERPLAVLARRLFDGQADIPEEETGRPIALPEIAESDYRTPSDLAALFSGSNPNLAITPVLRALDRVSAAMQSTEKLPRAPNVRLLLVVDQLDELYEAGVRAAERARFSRMLAALVASGRVWVAATLRAHLYEHVLTDPDLLAVKSGGAALDLAPPKPEGLAEIVRGPAEAAGLAFEANDKGERLDDRLLADAGGEADMLPLLQLALDRLFEKRSERNGTTVLTFAAYQELAGLPGIIDREAERVLAALGEESIAAIPRLLRQLVFATSDGLSIRAAVAKDVIADVPARKLVDALVDARILILAGEGDRTTIQLAHRRVLTDWARANAIATENAEFFQIRAEVDERRRKWKDAGEHRDLLIPGGRPLAEAEEFLKHFGPEVKPETREYIVLSSARARRTQRLIKGAAASFALLALAAGAAAKIAFDERAAAERQTGRAEQHFTAAREAVDELTFDIAHGLRDLEGMQIATVRKLLDLVRTTTDRMAGTDPGNPDLQRSRMLMLNEFVETYLAAGDIGSARQAAEQSVSIAEGLYTGGPANNRREQDLAIALEHLGDVKLAAGEAVAALAAFERDLDISRRLAAQAPKDEEKLRSLSVCLNRIGDAKAARKDVVGALAAYGEAYEIRKQLASSVPADPIRQRDVSISLEKIADLKLAKGERAEAFADYEEVLRIRRAISAQQLGNAEWARDVSVTLEKIGDAKFAAADFAEALAAYEQALAPREHLAQMDEANVGWQTDLVVILRKIADASDDLARKQKSLERALRIVDRLQENQALMGAQKTWPDAIRNELDALKGHPEK